MTRATGFLCAGIIASLACMQAASAAGQPDRPPPPPGAPNIVIILIDDIGYGNTSTFGGTAKTPFLDQFAAQGLRYDNFNTVAICSSTRAALLTGLNHHRVGFGSLADLPGVAPGYDTRWKKDALCVADVLRHNGYDTAAIGKWHDTPWTDIGPEGPFDRWPTGLGFDYFYGFMEPGASSQWEPSSLYRDTTPVEPWGTPAQGYLLTPDLTNEAINWVQTHESLSPARPYFLYFATGAVHYPHQVPAEWIAKYRGQFDEGWDKWREEAFARQKKLGVVPAGAELTLRPKELPAWDSLSPDQKKLYARQMEVYAGYISETDDEVGRLLKTVQGGPQGNNTLIFYLVGDNGGSPGSEDVGDVHQQLRYLDELGGPNHLNGLTAAWGWASGVPFQWFKGVASHFGGVRDPLLISWPAKIKDHGGMRTQFAHVNDIAPTIYEAAGITYPAMMNGIKPMALDGTSLVYTFDHPDAPSRHNTQYFEMFGNRAMYQDGWIAAARHTAHDFAHDKWELYDVDHDYSEAHDLAAQYPDKLKALQALFDSEAKRNGVYPLGGAGHTYGSLAKGNHFVYHAGMPRILGLAAPDFLRSHCITAEVNLPAAGAQGVLVSFGGRCDGFVLYVKDGHFICDNNFEGTHQVLTSSAPVPAGDVELAYEFTRGPAKIPSGVGRLYINGQASGEMTQSIDGRGAFWGCFGVGQAFGSPVSDAYVMPAKFTGGLKQVTIDLK